VQNKNRKNLYKILFITILLGFIISLVGCNWLSFGLLNIFDPQAQIRVSYTGIDLTEGEGTIDFEISTINEVEFIGEGFSYKYYNDGVLIPELSKTVGKTFYVPPLETIEISNMPLYYQEVLDYVKMNPMITEVTCTISLFGTDGAGHNITQSITFDMPALQPGIDFVPPEAKIVTDPSPPSGNIPLTVTFDASSSTDDRGIASYFWNFGDGKTSTSIVVSHTYDTPGSYPVTLTVTDYFNNQGIDTVTVEAGDASGPTAAIETFPDPPYVVDQTITFDGTASAVSGDCGSGATIVSYIWNFGDGETDSGSIVTHSYDTADTYTVTLTVTDSNGKSAVTSVTVTIT